MPWGLWLLGLLVLLIIAWGAWRARRAAGDKLPGWPADLAALVLLAGAALGFFWRVVTGQNWMPADGGDLVSFLYPTYRFAAAQLHNGAWPLWNPFLYAGAPHAADIQAGFLYPPNLLLFWLRPDFPYVALQWLSIVHVWFAGACLYLFLARGYRLRRLAALAGALAFMFSDALLVHFGNLNLIAVASWTPWVFWAYITGLDPSPNREAVLANASGNRPRFGMGWAAVSGVLLAIATLAGHIQVTLFILLALAVYTCTWLYLWRTEPAPGRRALGAAAYGAIAAGVTVLLAAPVLLPALQLTRYTARAAWNYQEAAGYSVSPAQWIGLLMPGFFGRAPQFHWGVWPRVEVGYVGILPLVLVILAVALRRDRRTWAWVTLAGVAFLLALGTYALPHGWLTLLPGFGQLRAPARLVFVTDFALATLAALGFDAVLAPIEDEARVTLTKVVRILAYATAVTLGVLAPLSYLALLLVQDRDPSVVLHVSVAVISVMILGGLLLASLAWLAARRGGWAAPLTLGCLAVILIFLDLGSTGAYQDLGNEDPSRAFHQPAIAAFLQSQPGPFRIDTRTDIQDKWQPDGALFYRLEDVTGLANPLSLSDVERYWSGLGSRSSRLYDLLNVGYVIAHKDVVLDWDKFELAFEGSPDLNVYRNRRALPRAYIVPQWQNVKDHEAAWQAIHADGFDPASTAAVEGPAVQAGGGQGEVTALNDVPNGLTLKATLSGPAMLVLSQVWYPGWSVWVDGSPRGQPLRADYLFQGIPLDAGTHEVVLRFVPPLWTVGWLLAAATALALCAWLVISWRVRHAASTDVQQESTAKKAPAM